jgi:hypothetical protein
VRATINRTDEHRPVAARARISLGPNGDHAYQHVQIAELNGLNAAA